MEGVKLCDFKVEIMNTAILSNNNNNNNKDRYRPIYIAYI